jgi:uncharacterized protein (TIGR02265 family)
MSAPERPVVFGNSVEALLRVLQPVLTPALAARFRQLGVDLHHPNPAYPYELWVEALRLAMATLYPDASHDEATYRLGRAIFETYGSTLLGKALLQLLRVVGPKRGLERMARNLRTTNNYSETRLVEHGAGHFELWVNRAAFPHYFRGLLEAGLEFAGARQVHVRLLRSGAEATPPDPSVTFELRWATSAAASQT